MSKGHCFSCGAWIHHLDGMLISLCPACDKEAHGDDALMENALAPRKAVQIAAYFSPELEGRYPAAHVVLALGDDGTLWEMQGATWTALPPLPQGPVAGGGES